MKKIISHSRIVFLIGALFITMSCSDWLTPDVRSFFTPENFDARGLEAVVMDAEWEMRRVFFGDAAPIFTEFVLSDMAVDGTTDRIGAPIDLDIFMRPTNRLGANDMLNHQDGARIAWFWRYSYRGIATANTVISRIDYATWPNEAQRNNVLGAALFQRAWRFFYLVHQFGDVPWVGEEIIGPKLDFYTYCRWSILRQLRVDMEWAVQHIAVNPPRGRTTRGGAQVLLMKIYMALGYFDEAVTLGHTIVANHPLMTERLPGDPHSPFQSPYRTNLMHDLHSIAGRESVANREGIMWMVADPAGTSAMGSPNIETMRNAVPFWAWGVRVFNIPGFPGQAGMQPALPAGTRPPAFGGGAWSEVLDGPLDMGRRYGRGIGRMRPTHYFTHDIWTDREQNDMRGPLHKSLVPRDGLPDTLMRDSWRYPTDLVFNNQALRYHSNPDIRRWYGQHVRPGVMTLSDSIRAWFPWPHFKLFVPQPQQSGNNWVGGPTPWYLFRSAEVYIMLAESYYWLDRPAEAAAMLNVVRTRAGALPLIAADIDIAAILDERARELYYEELRKSELTRIAFTYAKLGDRYGRACSVFGRVYSLTNFSGPGGVGTNYKGQGVNFFFDWVNSRNNFFNNPLKVTTAGTYRMSVHHVLWPVPDAARDPNTLGHINQNIGYPGAEHNLTPRVLAPVPPQ